MFINRVPTKKKMAKRDVAKPRISGSTTSPMYRGITVYKQPSDIPIANLKAVNNQIFFAEDIPKNEAKVTGAKMSTDIFLPSRSDRRSAIIAPTTHPARGEIEHHAPSKFVVGIVDELDNK